MSNFYNPLQQYGVSGEFQGQRNSSPYDYDVPDPYGFTRNPIWDYILSLSAAAADRQQATNQQAMARYGRKGTAGWQNRNADGTMVDWSKAGTSATSPPATGGNSSGTQQQSQQTSYYDANGQPPGQADYDQKKADLARITDEQNPSPAPAAQGDSGPTLAAQSVQSAPYGGSTAMAESSPRTDRNVSFASNESPYDYTPNVFEDKSLTFSEAVSACGPAAAVAFARAAGRNPTLREAVTIASGKNLWSESTGMYGPSAQMQLLQNLGVDAEIAGGVDEETFKNAMRGGKPVVVSTAGSGGHYYVFNGGPDENGRYFAGNSGTTLRNGSARLSYADVVNRGYPVNAIITMTSPAASRASAAPEPEASEQYADYETAPAEPTAIPGVF